MINEREYFKRWRQVPSEKCPLDISKKVVQKSGILNNPTPVRTRYSQRAYLCANLALVLLILLLIGSDLHGSDHQGQKRLAANTISLAQKASLSLQTAVFEKERNELQ